MSQITTNPQSDDGHSIFVTRHGARIDWVDKNWLLEAERPQDPPLSSQGERQVTIAAVELGEALAISHIKRIYCSPLYRTLQTATQVADRLNIPIFVEYGLHEWSSPESVPQPLPLHQLKELFPKIDTSYVSNQSLPDRESREQFTARVQRTAEFLESTFATSEGSLLAVTHASSVVTLGRALLRDYHATVRSGVCSISRYDGKPQAWTHAFNGSSAHLKEGEVANWEFAEDVEARERAERLTAQP
ncbi:hypothetical protein PROFUN_03932 [Planoprotostelium fungivorum]|uniref:Phosphoglycerate mutase family protein n=1 Tax=Planoprotostelium fungivorum TaxID=1890364 RepID=A0A2P6MTV8_9EUKA|nr:hypothetical protein PROFUN_03932 [Planoprotostelium fungivorum]